MKNKTLTTLTLTLALILASCTSTPGLKTETTAHPEFEQCMDEPNMEWDNQEQECKKKQKFNPCKNIEEIQKREICLDRVNLRTDDRIQKAINTKKKFTPVTFQITAEIKNLQPQANAYNNRELISTNFTWSNRTNVTIGKVTLEHNQRITRYRDGSNVENVITTTFQEPNQNSRNQTKEISEWAVFEVKNFPSANETTIGIQTEEIFYISKANQTTYSIEIDMSEENPMYQITNIYAQKLEEG